MGRITKWRNYLLVVVAISLVEAFVSVNRTDLENFDLHVFVSNRFAVVCILVALVSLIGAFVMSVRIKNLRRRNTKYCRKTV